MVASVDLWPCFDGFKMAFFIADHWQDPPRLPRRNRNPASTRAASQRAQLAGHFWRFSACLLGHRAHERRGTAGQNPQTKVLFGERSAGSIGNYHRRRQVFTSQRRKFLSIMYLPIYKTQEFAKYVGCSSGFEASQHFVRRWRRRPIHAAHHWFRIRQTIASR